MSLWLTRVGGIALLALTLLPVFRPASEDGFPFSTYPMFAQRRDRPLLHLAEGVTDTGETVALPPELVASGSVMQALGTLQRAAAQGAPALKPICERIAERAAASKSLLRIRRVQLVAARFDPIGYFEGRREPEQRQVLQRCRVRRGS